MESKSKMKFSIDSGAIRTRAHRSGPAPEAGALDRSATLSLLNTIISGCIYNASLNLTQTRHTPATGVVKCCHRLT